MEPEKLARAWIKADDLRTWENLPDAQKAYRALWEPTTGKPWTHVMRENPKTYWLLVAAGIAKLFYEAGRQWWVVALAFGIGLLTGHVFW